jgi:hypothetical protein
LGAAIFSWLSSIYHGQPTTEKFAFFGSPRLLDTSLQIKPDESEVLEEKWPRVTLEWATRGNPQS